MRDGLRDLAERGRALPRRVDDSFQLSYVLCEWLQNQAAIPVQPELQSLALTQLHLLPNFLGDRNLSLAGESTDGHLPYSVIFSLP